MKHTYVESSRSLMTVSVALVYAFFSILGSNILSSSIRKLILCVLVLSSLTPSVISEYSSDEDFPTETPAPILLLNPRGFVNCGHAQKQLMVDSSLFDLGTVLDKCWHHGVTLDEIEYGLKSVPEREDIENYEYADLYLLCEDVFTGNTSKLTSSLVRDYLECQSAGALQFEVMGYVERRFAEIIEVFTIGIQARECASDSECGGIKGASCLESIFVRDSKLRCLCGDYTEPRNGQCNNQFKSVKVLCNDNDECTPGAQCVVGNDTTLPGRRCWCTQGYTTDVDMQCSGTQVLAISALTFIASMMLAGNL